MSDRSETKPPADEGRLDRRVRRDDWRTAYCDAYFAAWGRKAEILESAAGWYRIRTATHGDSLQYRRKQIEQMTERLRATTAGLSA